jgi:hypothetical protein
MAIRSLKSRGKLAYRALVGATTYEKLEFWRHLGYWPDLANPRTFNERVCARKFSQFPQAPLLVDKLAVREFVRARAGGKFLTRLYYVGDDPEAVDFAGLPSQFVMKGTHGSGPELRSLISDKSALSRTKFITLASQILHRRCGPEVNEWWYTKVKPNLLIEEMLIESGQLPLDFKFYVFGGRALYIQVVSGRHGYAAQSCFYSHEWRLQPFVRGHFDALDGCSRPENLSEMIILAELLSTGLDFVRVDLYSVGRRTVFGEMTLAPGAGWIAFLPRNYDYILGEHWPPKGRSPMSHVTSAPQQAKISECDRYRT